MKMRKVLSLILCLCMVFVLLPSAAIAADSEGEFKEEGGELYFISPWTLPARIPMETNGAIP